MKDTSQTDVLQGLKGLYEQHLTALNSLLGGALPDPIKGELTRLKESLGRKLEALGALKETPEPAVAITALGEAVAFFKDYSANLLAKLTEADATVATKVTALNSLEKQVADGELLGKDKVKELCDVARAEGVNSLKPALAAERKRTLELAGLPVPDEAVLLADAEAFGRQVDGARENLKALETKGLKIGGRGSALATELAWLSKEQFDTRLKVLDEVLAPAAADPAPPAKAADPIAGNTGPAKPARRASLIGIA